MHTRLQWSSIGRLNMWQTNHRVSCGEWDGLKPLLDRHPEYQELAARMMSLYHAITTQALANEQASS